MFAKRLKELRNKYHLSQTELATVLNISNRTISMYERGYSEPSADVLAKIATHFNVTADYLIGITNSKNPDNRILSDKLNLSDEAIDILKSFPLTISRINGVSLSDILNAMIINPKFEEILKSILLYLSRNSHDWEEMSKFITQGILELNVNEVKKLSQTSITNNFDSLLTKLLNTEIETYNHIDTLPDGIHISARHKPSATE